jgi:magnesium-transporting ATPase (P-type)
MKNNFGSIASFILFVGSAAATAINFIGAISTEIYTQYLWIKEAPATLPEILKMMPYSASASSSTSMARDVWNHIYHPNLLLLNNFLWLAFAAGIVSAIASAFFMAASADSKG